MILCFSSLGAHPSADVQRNLRIKSVCLHPKLQYKAALLMGWLVTIPIWRAGFSASISEATFLFYFQRRKLNQSVFLHPHFSSRKPEIFDNTNIIMYQKVAKICVL